MSDLIEKIHRSPKKFVLALTGGGSKALGKLLSIPGASETVLEASIPYHSQALITYLGQEPENSASSSTARNLAMAAWHRARTINQSHVNVAGVGVTCALTTKRRRLGTNRCHIAIQTSTQTSEINVVLNGETSSRQDEESIISDLIIQQLADFCGLKAPYPTVPGKILKRTKKASETWSNLLTGKLKTTLSSKDSLNIFPGAFNPFHKGHKEIIAYSEQLLGDEVYLEISISNVDKLPIDFLTMQDRQKQINKNPLIFTNAPTFLEKARLFPRACFILGVDTVLRIVDKKYYGNDEQLLASSIDEICELGCKMVVFGRHFDGKFLTLDNLTLPEKIKRLCVGVGEEEFRSDISSTLLREPK